MNTIRKMTVSKIKQKKGKEKIVMLTAYDFLFASILDAAEVDIILVGDSVGTVLLGYDTTIPVTLEVMLHHSKAVSRAVSHSLVVVDMPFLTYNISVKKTLLNAGKIMSESGANAVKLEGGSNIVKQVKSLVANNIPVMGHLGLTPQSVHKFGGYKVQGKSKEEHNKIIEESLILQEAGIFSLVLECVPENLTKEISSKLSIPVIGIGAGKFADGQVIVTHDLLGFFKDFKPKFVKRYKDLYSESFDAVNSFIRDVRNSNFPDSEHSF